MIQAAIGSRGVLVAGLLVSLAVIRASAGETLAPSLALGPEWLPENRATVSLAPGVELTQIVRGMLDSRDRYVVQASFRSSAEAAAADVAALRQAGYDPVILVIDERPMDDPRTTPEGYAVREGAYLSQADAAAAQSTIAALGFPPRCCTRARMRPTIRRAPGPSTFSRSTRRTRE
jgi:hypothetical protein